MREKELEILFKHFLTKEKAYPINSVLAQASIGDKDKSLRSRRIADMLLLDTDNENYLALIEFKSFKEKNKAVNQVLEYLALIGNPSLLAYVVTPSGNNENDFIIYVIDENELKELSKEEFPYYESLRTKGLIDEKLLFEQIETKKKLKQDYKNRLVKNAWAGALIATCIISVMSILDYFYKSYSDRELLNRTRLVASQYQEIIEENTELRKQLHLMLNTNTNDSINSIHYSDKFYRHEMDSLSARIQNIEEFIRQSPQKVIEMNNISLNLQSTKDLFLKEKEINEIKITELKEKISLISTWGAGLLFVIIGAIVGFSIGLFRKN